MTRLSAPLAGPARRFSCSDGEGIADRGFVERHHRVAVIFLVAGVDQGVERERVVVGRGDVFFDQGAEDAGFDFSEEHGIHWNCNSNSREFGGIFRREALNTENTEDTGEPKSKSPPSRKICETGGAPSRFFLEQRGGAALPGLAFFLRDFFHVSDVGSGLG